MAKERADSNLSHEERKALRRAEKKEKKRSDTDGVRKVKDKKEKKDKEKKKKKTTTTGERAVLAEKITNPVEDGTVAMVVDKEEKGEEGKGKEGGADEVGKENKEAMKSEGHDDEDEAEAEAETDGENRKKKNTKDGKVMMRPVGALVPFANPLADEKVAKKIFKGVKKAAASKSLKRGVKEVVKALRKSPTTSSSPPPGIVVLAADISPMDVISHIPVLCEDHSVPYIYVPSRAELGMAGQTKRPTSVVMLTGTMGGKVKKEGEKEREGEEDWKESFAGLVKVVEREGRHVKI